MASAPQNVYNAVHPLAQCPDAIWEVIVSIESGFNTMDVGDNGSSFGLFQLHIGGQADLALSFIQQQQKIGYQAAITYLLQHADVQAKFGMPAINNAWNALKNSFNAKDQGWWLQFCSMSGHPGGNPNDPVTQAYVHKVMTSYVNTNAFGIQQVAAGSGQSASQGKVDNTWLQVLLNKPPHQPCNVVWRRTCPNAKNANEGGMDLNSPGGTKVYALGDGEVVGAGYFWHPQNNNPGYGVVTVRTRFPDGSIGDLYYQHIQIANSIILCNQTGGALYHGVVGPKPSGQKIQRGQLLGTVTPGVNEVEVGINADWGGIWGSSPHPGPWVDDPEDLVRSLINAGGGTNTNSITQFTQTITGGANPKVEAYLTDAFANTETAVETITTIPGLAGPIQAFDNAQQFHPFAVPDDTSGSANWPIWGGIEQGASYPARLFMGVIKFFLDNTMAFLIRGIFVMFALIVIIALLINLMSQVREESMDEAGNLLPLAEAAMV